MERNSFAVLVSSLAEGADISNRLAPEHLEVHTRDPESLLPILHHYGAIFLGNFAAEVLGDYGAGPNHTLPTGGTARSFGGLSVHTFTRVRTWLKVDDCKVRVMRCHANCSSRGLQAGRGMIQDAVDLALFEGLHGHSRAAQLRITSSQ